MTEDHDLVSLTIDGTPLSVPKGTLLIRAAERLGIEIPRFCDHPLLDPVAACRQCYVQVEGQRKLLTSCSTPATEGMAVHTQFSSEEVRAAQESVLEFLLINHPLDCPVCDRGGECPLQDQALAFGPGETRYIEAKRTYRKPLPLSPLVYLDRERCVLCQRCTRFCDQIPGDRFIELFDRGGAEQIAIAAGEDFRSPFSGNTIQICPVGALTASTYRFAARPFDVVSKDSVCSHCASGCNLSVQLRDGEVVRHLARDNLDVNEAWVCDKGRFAFSYVDRADRLTMPLLRDPVLEPVSYAEAFRAIAERLTAPGGVPCRGPLGRGRLRPLEVRPGGVRDERHRPPARRRRRRAARHRGGAGGGRAGHLRRRRTGEGHPGGRAGHRAGTADPAPADPQGRPGERREGLRRASSANPPVGRRRASAVPAGRRGIECCLVVGRVRGVGAAARVAAGRSGRRTGALWCWPDRGWPKAPARRPEPRRWRPRPRRASRWCAGERTTAARCGPASTRGSCPAGGR